MMNNDFRTWGYYCSYGEVNGNRDTPVFAVNDTPFIVVDKIRDTQVGKWDYLQQECNIIFLSTVHVTEELTILGRNIIFLEDVKVQRGNLHLEATDKIICLGGTILTEGRNNHKKIIYAGKKVIHKEILETRKWFIDCLCREAVGRCNSSGEEDQRADSCRKVIKQLYLACSDPKGNRWQDQQEVVPESFDFLGVPRIILSEEE